MTPLWMTAWLIRRSLWSRVINGVWPLRVGDDGISLGGIPLKASGSPFVQGDDAGAPKAHVVLERVLKAFDLPLVGRAAQLVGELVALGETGGSERMALRQEPSGRVGHDPAAVGVIA